MRRYLPIFLVLLLVGGCTAIEVVKPKLDSVYDDALKVWCVAPAATHLRAINRGSIQARSLTDNCPAWRAIKNALVGSTEPVTLESLADFMEDRRIQP